MKNTLFILGAIVGLLSLGGCMNMNNSHTLDQLSSAVSSSSPVVEAFIEYPGTHERWVGPKSFVLHVSAKEKGKAIVEMLPGFFTEFQQVEEFAHRAPSSLRLAATAHSPAEKGIHEDLAKDYLNQFSAVLSDEQPNFTGCLYPIRVRLVRGNGALVEKLGCRGYGKISASTSDFVNFFLSAQMYGATESKTTQSTKNPGDKELTPQS